MEEGKSIEKEISKNVKTYLFQDKSIDKSQFNDERVYLKFEKLGGMCNDNYLVTVKEKKTNKNIFQLVYKKFGIISKTGDHLLESNIMEYLSSKGIGPKLFLEKKSYRLMEYIPDTRHIEKELLFNERILNQLSEILDIYNQFTSPYLYFIENNKIYIEPLKSNHSSFKNLNVSKTYYENLNNTIYKKAKISFNKFKNELKENIPLKGNEELYETVNKYNNYIDNFPENINKFYPKEGFLVMCHNDVNRGNFIQKISDEKLYCLDHEYASLNLPGYDIADYLNESNFHFSPNYSFTFEDINYDKYFEIYNKYIQKFKEFYKFLNNNIKGKHFFEYINSKKYYLSLHQIINYFWFLCCITYLDFKLWQKGKKNSFYIANDLLRFYEYGLTKVDCC